MAVDDLEAQRRCGRRRRRARCQRSEQAPAPARRAQPRRSGPARRCRRARAARRAPPRRSARSASASPGPSPGRRSRLAPACRRGRACRRTAERRRRPAAARIQLAQFAQRCPAEAREHQEAVDRRARVPAREQRRRVGDGVQHHVGPDQLARGRSRLAAPTHSSRPRAASAGATTTAGARAARGARQRRIGLDRDALRLRVGGAQQRRRRRRAPAHQSSERCGCSADRSAAARPCGAPPRRAARAARRRGARRAARRATATRDRRRARRAALRSAGHAGSILSRCLHALAAPAPMRVAPARCAQRGCPACARSAAAGADGRVCAACLAALRRAACRAAPLRAARCRRRAASAAPAWPTPPPFDAALAARRLRAPVGPPDRRASSSTARSIWPRAFAAAHRAALRDGAARAARRRCCCRCRWRPRGCASAATTRPGSWRAGSARRLGCRPTPTLLQRAARHAAPARHCRRAERAAQPARRVRGRAAAARRAARAATSPLVDDVMTTGAHRRRGRARAARRRPAPRRSRSGCWRARRARATEPDGTPMFNIVLVAARDPAQHRQRDPPGRQHRLRAAPGRAARLLDGRQAAAPRRPRLPRVRRRPAPRVVAGVARGRTARPGALFAFTTRGARAPRASRACRPATGWCSAARRAGLPAALRDGVAPAQRVRLPMRPASAA